MVKLLVVDDEADLIAELKPFLERMGYTVITASDGESALTKIAESKPDLIVLDVIMPRLDGREVLRRLRRADNWTPIILLTRVGNTAERTLGLQEGADDYLNKPFDALELVARIQAILRRSQARPESPSLHSARELICDDIVLERQTRRIKLGGSVLPLSARAVSVLEFLMLNAGKVIPRDELLNQVWGWNYPIETRAVDIRIAELRKALKDDADQPRFIETVVGQGYRFIGDVEGR
jgi:DNA-binding response OmpR family regulator